MKEIHSDMKSKFLITRI